MPTDPVKTESSLEEQLVAYLDGELDAEAVRRIEERLAAEPEVRAALNRLERTWDLLDELGSTPVGDSFTRTTLEMVTVAAEEDVQQAIAAAPIRRRRRRWLIGGGMLAAAAAGFLAAYLALPNPNRQLLHDLPVLENLEEYCQVDDIKFLRLLEEKGLFPKEQLPTAEVPVKDNPRIESAAPLETAAWVEKLPPDKKADLSRKKEVFDKIPPLEQEKLRRLCEEVQKDQDSAELRRIMRDYYEWWKSLPPFSRNALISLSSPQARIERIEQLKQEETKHNAMKNLSAADTAVLRDWMEQYITKFEILHLKSISEEARKKWEDRPEPQRRLAIMGFLFWQRGPGGGNRTLQSPEDLAELQKKLSADAQQLLKDKPPPEQWKTIREWLQSLAPRKFDPRTMRRPGSLVDENEIAKFFDSLPDQEKMGLLNLPPEDMQHELQRRWYLSRMKPMQSILGPEGSPFDGPRRPRDNPDWKPPDGPEKAPGKPE